LKIKEEKQANNTHLKTLSNVQLSLLTEYFSIKPKSTTEL